jgi:DnaA family protein
MNSQLPLHIGLRDSATFANYFPGPNAQLLHCLEQGREPFVYLWGAGGSGKSHLLQAACHAASETGAGTAYLPLADLVRMSPDLLEGLEQMGVIAIEDIETVAGNREWEVALFNLYNRVREQGGRLYVAGSGPPASLGLTLPDLVSRLSWGPVFQLEPLSDEEKLRALQLRAKGRGMVLPDEVAEYLMKHTERDLHNLFELLERLDRESLAAQRKLTIPFVRDLIVKVGK